MRSKQPENMDQGLPQNEAPSEQAYHEFIQSVDTIYSKMEVHSQIDLKDIETLVVKLHNLNSLVPQVNISEFIEHIVRYIEIVLTHISALNNYKKEQKYLRRLISTIPDFFEKTETSATFIKEAGVRILDLFFYSEFSLASKRQMLGFFNRVASKSTKEVRINLANDILYFMYKLVDSLSTYGDYGLQTDIMETLFRIYGYHIRNKKFEYDLLPGSAELVEQLVSGISRDNFDVHIRYWLNKFNEKSKLIFTLPCEKIFFGDVPMKNIHEFEPTFYLDFNLKEQMLSFHTEEDPSLWNRVLFNANNVSKVTVKRHFSQSDNVTIVTMTIFKPCISDSPEYQDYYSSLSKTLQIVISNEKKERITRLISYVLPSLFGSVFEHTSARISQGLRPVYKPLGTKSGRKGSSLGSKSVSVVEILSSKAGSSSAGSKEVTSLPKTKIFTSLQPQPVDVATASLKGGVSQATKENCQNASFEVTEYSRATLASERASSVASPNSNIFSASRASSQSAVLSNSRPCIGSQVTSFLDKNISFEPSEVFASSPLKRSKLTEDLFETAEEMDQGVHGSEKVSQLKAPEDVNFDNFETAVEDLSNIEIEEGTDYQKISHFKALADEELSQVVDIEDEVEIERPKIQEESELQRKTHFSIEIGSGVENTHSKSDDISSQNLMSEVAQSICPTSEIQNSNETMSQDIFTIVTKEYKKADSQTQEKNFTEVSTAVNVGTDSQAPYSQSPLVIDLTQDEPEVTVVEKTAHIEAERQCLNQDYVAEELPVLNTQELLEVLGNSSPESSPKAVRTPKTHDEPPVKPIPIVTDEHEEEKPAKQTRRKKGRKLVKTGQKKFSLDSCVPNAVHSPRQTVEELKETENMDNTVATEDSKKTSHKERAPMRDTARTRNQTEFTQQEESLQSNKQTQIKSPMPIKSTQKEQMLITDERPISALSQSTVEKHIKSSRKKERETREEQMKLIQKELTIQLTQMSIVPPADSEESNFDFVPEVNIENVEVIKYPPKKSSSKEHSKCPLKVEIMDTEGALEKLTISVPEMPTPSVENVKIIGESIVSQDSAFSGFIQKKVARRLVSSEDSVDSLLTGDIQSGISSQLFSSPELTKNEQKQSCNAHIESPPEVQVKHTERELTECTQQEINVDLTRKRSWENAEIIDEPIVSKSSVLSGFIQKKAARRLVSSDDSVDSLLTENKYSGVCTELFPEFTKDEQKESPLETLDNSHQTERGPTEGDSKQLTVQLTQMPIPSPIRELVSSQERSLESEEIRDTPQLSIVSQGSVLKGFSQKKIGTNSEKGLEEKRSRVFTEMFSSPEVTKNEQTQKRQLKSLPKLQKNLPYQEQTEFPQIKLNAHVSPSPSRNQSLNIIRENIETTDKPDLPILSQGSGSREFIQKKTAKRIMSSEDEGVSELPGMEASKVLPSEEFEKVAEITVYDNANQHQSYGSTKFKDQKLEGVSEVEPQEGDSNMSIAKRKNFNLTIATDLKSSGDQVPQKQSGSSPDKLENETPPVVTQAEVYATADGQDCRLQEKMQVNAATQEKASEPLKPVNGTAITNLSPQFDEILCVTEKAQSSPAIHQVADGKPKRPNVKALKNKKLDDSFELIQQAWVAEGKPPAKTGGNQAKNRTLYKQGSYSYLDELVLGDTPEMSTPEPVSKPPRKSTTRKQKNNSTLAKGKRTKRTKAPRNKSKQDSKYQSSQFKDPKYRFNLNELFEEACRTNLLKEGKSPQEVDRILNRNILDVGFDKSDIFARTEKAEKSEDEPAAPTKASDSFVISPDSEGFYWPELEVEPARPKIKILQNVVIPAKVETQFPKDKEILTPRQRESTIEYNIVDDYEENDSQKQIPIEIEALRKPELTTEVNIVDEYEEREFEKQIPKEKVNLPPRKRASKIRKIVDEDKENVPPKKIKLDNDFPAESTLSGVQNNAIKIMMVMLNLLAAPREKIEAVRREVLMVVEAIQPIETELNL